MYTISKTRGFFCMLSVSLGSLAVLQAVAHMPNDWGNVALTCTLFMLVGFAFILAGILNLGK